MSGRKGDSEADASGNIAGSEARDGEPRAATLDLELHSDVDPEDINASLELGMLAQRLQLAAERGDEDARDIAAVLWAMKANPEWRKRIARQARDRLRKHNRGPRTRTQEAEALANLIRRGLDDGESIEQIATTVVRRVCYVWSELRALTKIPPPPWPDHHEMRRAAAAEVAKAMYRADPVDPERLAKAALRALGSPALKTRNLYSFADQRQRRRGEQSPGEAGS